MDEYTIRQAGKTDVAPVMALLDEAARWLAERGTDQWQGADERRRIQVERDVDEGTLWVVVDAGHIVATVTVDTFADTEFWTHDDQVDGALYAHRMAVARSHAGQEIGSALLDFAAELAEEHGRWWLRLDAWATNQELHHYYKTRGFEMLRNVPRAGRGSGALFERAARDRSGGPPLVRTSETAPSTEVAVNVVP